MKSFKLCLVAVALILSACGKESATDYAGNWVNLKDARSTIAIAKNGDNYTVKLNKINQMTKNVNTMNMSGSIKDGMLAIPNGIGDTVLNIDKSTGHITSEYGEFVKVQ